MPYVLVRSYIRQQTEPEQGRWQSESGRHQQRNQPRAYPPEFHWTTYIDWAKKAGGEGTVIEAEISRHLSAVRLGDSPNYFSYRTNEPPCVVLDLLESQGYKGVGESPLPYKLNSDTTSHAYTWTLHKEAESRTSEGKMQ